MFIEITKHPKERAPKVHQRNLNKKKICIATLQEATKDYA